VAYGQKQSPAPSGAVTKEDWMESEITYMGKPLSDCSKEELIDAVTEQFKMNEERRRTEAFRKHLESLNGEMCWF